MNERSLSDEPVFGWRDPARRRVIVHYHLFKNAGSSVDAALKDAFGRRWIAIEHDDGVSPAALAAHLAAHPDPVAIGSHTAMFPAPEVHGVSILPVAFVRHPIDRVRSVYDFERRQFPVRKRGALVAKLVGFRRYVDWRLGYDELFRDFQVHRFGRGRGAPGDAPAARDYLASLPFVGVVERFAESMRLLEALVRHAHPEASLAVKHENSRSGREAALERRLAQTRADLGDALYERLVRENQGDLDLHDAANAKLDRDLARWCPTP